MGRRRGRTGPGGAVVSSLSTNAGGKVNTNSSNNNNNKDNSSNTTKNNTKNNSKSASKSDKANKADKKSGKKKYEEDEELNELAGLSTKKKNNKSASAGAASSSTPGASSSASASSSSWLGKSPQQMLREWCTKNNRKRPSFYPIEGSDGLVKCVIHSGKKDNTKKNDPAFRPIVGSGDKAGDDFAALNVLHQIEHGKPIERLLAPEYRGTWLNLDKRHEEQTVLQSKRTARKEAIETSKKRREFFDNLKVSATVHLSSESRQVIEDTILNQVGDVGSASGSNLTTDFEQKGVFGELMKMGFSEFDALYASQQFSNSAGATDYLCLTLDESELPATFAPTSEIEVVQFYPESSGKGPLLDPQSTNQFIRLSCLSKLSVSKAMKQNDGDPPKVYASLYNILTHGILNVKANNEFQGIEQARIDTERDAEMESIKAIYGEDVTAGVGAVSLLPSKWATVISLPEGCPGLHHAHPIAVAFVDLDNGYPFSAPAVIIASSIETDHSGANNLKAAERRLLMRAAAGEIYSLRSTSAPSTDSLSEPVPVIHGIISLLTDSSKEQIFRTASITNADNETSNETSNTGSSSGVRSSGSIAPTESRATQAYAKPKRPVPLVDSPALQNMRKQRRTLPAHSSRSSILSAIRSSQVSVISGATGSGKTTQVPQFILEEAAERGEKVSIICTQPRRVAAMSVAERVSDERCEPIGQCVGYHVKMNSKRSSNTCLLFCTTGVLLRRLQGNPLLQGLTHIVVDEVHERSVETDFLLLLLRKILSARPDLKIVLMSATLDAKRFSAYFKISQEYSKVPKVPIISIPGRTFPVEEFYLEEAVSFSGYRLSPNDKYARKPGANKNVRNREVANSNGKNKEKYANTPHPGFEFPRSEMTASAMADAIDYRGDRFDEEDGDEDEDTGTARIHESNSSLAMSASSTDTTKEIAALIDEEQVNDDLISKLVSKIDEVGRRANDMGAILIFLPGVAEISSVVRKLSYPPKLSQGLWVIPFHSLLSQQDMKKVFSKAPAGSRKVICATNIAETSITVEDVTVVIDTLRVKETGYDVDNGCTSLTEVFTSRAAAKQRAGRAGRVSAGKCYRLIRKHTFENRLRAQTKPEIQRVSLEHLILSIMTIIPKKTVAGDPPKFLEQALDPPEKESIQDAIKKLLNIGALRECGEESRHGTVVIGNTNRLVELTGLGMHLSRLPVDVKIGKLLVFGALFKCLDAALTMAATISERSPFAAPFDKRDEMKEAMKKFSWGKSDLLIYIEVFNSWRDIRENKNKGVENESSFLRRNFLSNKTLRAIEDSRRQLADSLAETGLCGVISAGKQRNWERGEAFNIHSLNERVLKAVICAGMYPNIVRLDMQQKYAKVHGGAIPVAGNSKDIKLRGPSMERMFLHPSSVNFDQAGYETRWLAYFSKMLTSKLFLRDSTMVTPYAILLFGGMIEVVHDKGQITVDKWIVFKAPARVGVLARELRKQVDSLLLNKFEDVSMDLAMSGQGVIEAIINLLNTEIYQL